jgi:hypothetical protein
MRSTMGRTHRRAPTERPPICTALRADWPIVRWTTCWDRLEDTPGVDEAEDTETGLSLLVELEPEEPVGDELALVGSAVLGVVDSAGGWRISAAVATVWATRGAGSGTYPAGSSPGATPVVWAVDPDAYCRKAA